MIPITIFMCSSPISQRLLAEKAIVWKITFTDFFFPIRETTNQKNHGTSHPRKKGRVFTGFKGSNALIGSDQRRAVDERVNVKSGLQSRPESFFLGNHKVKIDVKWCARNPSSETLLTGWTSRQLLWVKGLKSSQQEWSASFLFLWFQRANFLTI